MTLGGLRRVLASALTAALAVAVLPASAGAQADPGPVGYQYATEWIYSTNASETAEAVDTDASGRVFTVGSNAGYGDDKSTVRVYDPNGALLDSWEVPFPNLGDLVVDGAGNVHIADYSGHVPDEIPAKVYAFTPGGQLLRSYDLEYGAESAGGVGIGPNGRLYVASPTTDEVIVFNPDGSRYKTFGTEGTGAGQLKSPWGLDIAPDGSVVVADRDNDRVQVFTAEGAPVTRWGQAGTGPGQFVNGPQEVEVRADGNVYVVDTTSRVQVFTLGGGYLGTIPATTKRSGDTMSKVSSLAFGPGRELYVSGTLFPFENGIAKYVPAGAGAGVAKVKAPKGGLKVTKKKVKLTVKCVSATPCSGTATVTTKKGKPLAKPKAYSVPAGGKKKVAVKLTKKGLKTVRKKATTKAVVNVTGSNKVVKIRR